MTPLEIEILIHYRTSGVTCCDGDFSALDASQAVANLRDNWGLLERPDGQSVYRLTERGRAHVEALMALPLPEQVWVTPREES